MLETPKALYTKYINIYINVIIIKIIPPQHSWGGNYGQSAGNYIYIESSETICETFISINKDKMKI